MSHAEIDLDQRGRSDEPLKRFWAMVLLLALKDGASKVTYDPARGVQALTYEIGGIEYEMVAPDEAMAENIEKEIANALLPVPWWQRLFGKTRRTTANTAGVFFANVDSFVVRCEGMTDREF